MALTAVSWLSGRGSAVPKQERRSAATRALLAQAARRAAPADRNTTYLTFLTRPGRCAVWTRSGSCGSRRVPGLHGGEHFARHPVRGARYITSDRIMKCNTLLHYIHRRVLLSFQKHVRLPRHFRPLETSIFISHGAPRVSRGRVSSQLDSFLTARRQAAQRHGSKPRRPDRRTVRLAGLIGPFTHERIELCTDSNALRAGATAIKGRPLPCASSRWREPRRPWARRGLLATSPASRCTHMHTRNPHTRAQHKARLHVAL